MICIYPEKHPFIYPRGSIPLNPNYGDVKSKINRIWRKIFLYDPRDLLKKIEEQDLSSLNPKEAEVFDRYEKAILLADQLVKSGISWSGEKITIKEVLICNGYGRSVVQCDLKKYLSKNNVDDCHEEAINALDDWSKTEIGTTQRDYLWHPNAHDVLNQYLEENPNLLLDDHTDARAITEARFHVVDSYHDTEKSTDEWERFIVPWLEMIDLIKKTQIYTVKVQEDREFSAFDLLMCRPKFIDIVLDMFTPAILEKTESLEERKEYQNIILTWRKSCSDTYQGLKIVNDDSNIRTYRPNFSNLSKEARKKTKSLPKPSKSWYFDTKMLSQKFSEKSEGAPLRPY